MQLTVIEVLYQKQDIEREIDQQYDEDEQSDKEDDFSESNSCEDDDFFDNNELVDLDASHNGHRGNQYDVTEVSCGPVIKKVRKLIVMFRRSPKKHDILQKYVAAEFGKQITLIKDCKNSWNSLLSMLQRVYLLKNCIQKALIDISLLRLKLYLLSLIR